MSLLTPLVKLLQIAINRYLAYDPEAPKQLQTMQNKVVKLSFEPLSICLYVVINQDGLDIVDELSEPADTTIIGSPLALAMMGIQESSVASLFSGEVRIEGDAELGADFQQFLKNIEVDWQEPLSELTGDVVAHQFGELVDSFHSWFQESSANDALNLAEYYREEKKLLPSIFEMEKFKQDVDAIRLSADRLEAKVQRLMDAKNKNDKKVDNEA